MLQDVTPLTVDCGQLCDGACCAVTDEITGMYLFPGEKVMYDPMPDWGELHDIDFTYDNGKKVELFTCPGTCDRKLRPLSCRIFPLVPYAKREEKLEIKMDIRGKGMCPLATAMKIEDLNPEFVEKVKNSKGFCLHHFGDLCEAGENKLNDANKILGNCFSLTIIISIILTIVLLIFNNDLLY